MNAMKLIAAAAAAMTAVGGCQHNPAANSAALSASIDNRKLIAKETCEAQYEIERQNFLSAVETMIVRAALQPAVDQAPLDAFRAEINAAYNGAVAYCKTHINCLEVQSYDEARCYMSATDRKDAERRFADLSERLRQIELDSRASVAGAQANTGARVNVQTTVHQANKQKQKQSQRQKAKARIGDDIADQDVLVLCGDASGLLKRECRRPCGDRAC